MCIVCCSFFVQYGNKEPSSWQMHAQPTMLHIPILTLSQAKFIDRVNKHLKCFGIFIPKKNNVWTHLYEIATDVSAVEECKEQVPVDVHYHKGLAENWLLTKKEPPGLDVIAVLNMLADAIDHINIAFTWGTSWFAKERVKLQQHIRSSINAHPYHIRVQTPDPSHFILLFMFCVLLFSSSH